MTSKAPSPARDSVIAALRQEIMLLETKLSLAQDEISRLRKGLALPTHLVFPPSWRLTLQERRVIITLYARYPHYISASALRDTVRRSDTATGDRLPSTLVCKIRTKIPEVKITTLWGAGYALHPDTHSLLKGLSDVANLHR